MKSNFTIWQKLSMLFMGLLLVLLILGACNQTEASKAERFTSNDRYLNTTTDVKTGCKYIIFSSSQKGGVTPLLKSDGTPDCGK